jgi:hypothetical protein
MARLQRCPCGSRIWPDAHHDARGIFLCYACEKCEREKLSRYRPEVLTDPDYWHSEPIDDE